MYISGQKKGTGKNMLSNQYRGEEESGHTLKRFFFWGQKKGQKFTKL